MRIIIGGVLGTLALFALANFGWGSALFIFPGAIALLIMASLFRSGWTYDATDIKDEWNGKQYEYVKDGINHIVKDGVTYRQNIEKGQASGYDWGDPEKFKNRPKSKLIRR